jgi:predicted nucleotidyltransferase
VGPDTSAAVGPVKDAVPTKRNRTEQEIKAALASSGRLRGGYRVYAKGSYANDTNVRLDYDVDIAVECTDFFYSDTTGAPADVIKAAEARRVPYTKYGQAEFKNDVEQALVDYYGRSAVVRGNMAMRVREKKTTLPADVVPCFEYHYIYGFGANGGLLYRQGTRLYPDRGAYLHNWPQQQLERGIAKNAATGRRYKRMVRAFKRLENLLVDRGEIKALPSFFMECLVYNVPNDCFNHPTYVADMRSVLATIFNATQSDERCGEWVEASECKSLFHPDQAWTRQQAHELASEAWDLMGFE